jgi:PTS system D-glucosamine-specific IIC component
VYTAEKVRTDILKSTGASGVIQKGNGVQVIYGPSVTVIKSRLEDYLGKMPEEYDSIPEEITCVIASPYTGIAGEIKDIPDEGFASGMIGEGAFVELTEPDIFAPADGTVTFVFDSRHAIGFETEEGIALLLHVGIDTVNLHGEGFTVFVKEGDVVKKGDRLMRVDLDYIRSNAPSLASPIVFTGMDENAQIRLIHSGKIKSGENLIEIRTIRHTNVTK